MLRNPKPHKERNKKYNLFVTKIMKRANNFLNITSNICDWQKLKIHSKQAKLDGRVAFMYLHAWVKLSFYLRKKKVRRERKKNIGVLLLQWKVIVIPYLTTTFTIIHHSLYQWWSINHYVAVFLTFGSLILKLTQWKKNQFNSVYKLSSDIEPFGGKQKDFREIFIRSVKKSNGRNLWKQ
jgi:hypothetical protein